MLQAYNWKMPGCDLTEPDMCHRPFECRFLCAGSCWRDEALPSKYEGRLNPNLIARQSPHALGRSAGQESTMTHRALTLIALLLPITLLILPLTNIQMLTSIAARTASRLSIPRLYHRTMSSSTSAFTLDPNIFNQTFYKQVVATWLPGVDPRRDELDHNVLKRWFMLTGTERDDFDAICRNHFAHALEAIGPDKLLSPTAQPFLDEIDSKRDHEEAAWTALSLTILLDQIPRNLYRTELGLRKVYTHYDAMSYALCRTLLARERRVDLEPSRRRSAAHRLWFYMPLMHSEELEAHDLLDDILHEAMKDCEGLEASTIFVEGQIKAEKEHREILDRFGRYPHRNKALERVSTEEEVRFLEEGGATFGVGEEKENQG